MVVFDRPVGAQADAKELEYVSALHQTAPQVRTDGSISDQDISLFLRSRFGLDISCQQVRETILQGMGGSSEDGEVVDLMEMTAILLIPYFVKAAMVHRGEPLPEGTQRPSSHVLKHVCQMIIHDVCLDEDDDEEEEEEDITDIAEPHSDDPPPKLTVAFIQRILRAYGEDDLAADEALMRNMVHQVKDHNHFTTDALAQALTGDVGLYNPANEVRFANAYQDIMEQEAPVKTVQVQEHSDNIEDGPILLTEEVPETPQLTKKYTAPAIDSTAGTYRSKSLIVLLWGSVLFNYFTQDLGGAFDVDTEDSCREYVIGGTWNENWGTMSCETVNSIIFWLVNFIALCIFGVCWVGCGSLGNADGNTRAYKPLLAVFFMLMLVVIPYRSEGRQLDTDASVNYLRAVALILTIMVICLHLMHATYLLLPDTSALKARLNVHANQDEVNLKSAQSFKVDRLVRNAMDVHHSTDSQHVVKSCFGHALHVFSKKRKTERVGGLVWSWKQIHNGQMFTEEGIWYSARLIAANISQYIVVLYILLAGVLLSDHVKENFGKESTKKTLRSGVEYMIQTYVTEEQIFQVSASISTLMGSFIGQLNETGVANFDCSAVAVRGEAIFAETCKEFLGCDPKESAASLCALLDMPQQDGLTQLTFLKGAGLDADLLISQIERALQQSVDESVDSLYPSQEYMLTVPIAIGVAVAVLVSLYLAVSYLPSITATILQLRSGVIPTLSDKKLNSYRAAPDTVTLLTGSLFWGCLFSGILVGGIVALVSFLFLWQGSIYFVQRFVAIAIGVVLVALIRIAVMCAGRKKFFQSFYRKKPAAANIYFLAMEWANFSLAAGFVFVRMIKLIVVTAFSVGRIDTPFLAPGVGQLGPVELDPFPTIHMRDIMSHEAHRHPYIEMLGTVYLMKLRYGTLFGTNAGSCWRLIFVYALMPWMQKYRILDTPAKRMHHQHSDDEMDQPPDDDDDDVVDEMEVEKVERGLAVGSEMRKPAHAPRSMMSSISYAPRILVDSSRSAGSGNRKASVRDLRRENSSLRIKLAEMESRIKSANEKMRKTSSSADSVSDDC